MFTGLGLKGVLNDVNTRIACSLTITKTSSISVVGKATAYDSGVSFMM